MNKLDFSGREQLYYQIYSLLFQDIMNGKYRIGDMIPAESELMESYQVSRATARKAMEMLANDGLVRKRRGIGTFVTALKPKNDLNRVISYSKKNQADSAIVSKHTLDVNIQPANDELASRLKVEIKTPIIYLKRLRCADEEPSYLEFNYYEQDFVPEVYNRDFSKESLRAFLKNFYNIQWSYANQEIYSILAEEKLADLLQVNIGSPIIQIKRVSYDINNVPREFVSTFYRGDRHHLEIELSI